MADDIVLMPGGISVRPPDGRFKQVKTPTGFTDIAFRNAVAATDTAYRTLGQLPTVNEVHEFWPRIPVKTYAALFLTDEFKEALRYRGVEWDAEAGLSLEQTMALLKLTDWTDRRTTSAKLKELGIPMARYQAWMQNPLFKTSYTRRTEASLGDAVPMALNKLMGNAELGDQRAIEKILEITGRWNPAATQVEDARQVVMAVVEAVIRRVGDAQTRQDILADVALVAGTLGAIQPQNQLEG
jgi:hypothetical protein